MDAAALLIVVRIHVSDDNRVALRVELLNGRDRRSEVDEHSVKHILKGFEKLPFIDFKSRVLEVGAHFVCVGNF